jgi:hypothetical protein
VSSGLIQVVEEQDVRGVTAACGQVVAGDSVVAVANEVIRPLPNENVTASFRDRDRILAGAFREVWFG